MNLVHKKSDKASALIGPKTAIFHHIGLGADLLSRFPVFPPILRTFDVNAGLYRLLLV